MPCGLVSTRWCAGTLRQSTLTPDSSIWLNTWQPSKLRREVSLWAGAACPVFFCARSRRAVRPSCGLGYGRLPRWAGCGLPRSIIVIGINRKRMSVLAMVP